MPGDIAIGDPEGITFVPPQLAEKVADDTEMDHLVDEWGHTMLREGKYTPGQIDAKWTKQMVEEFNAWLEKRGSKLRMPPPEIIRIIEFRFLDAMASSSRSQSRSGDPRFCQAACSRNRRESCSATILSSPGCSMNEFMASPGRVFTGLRSQWTGFELRSSLRGLLWRQGNAGRVPRDAHVRHVIGDVGHEERCAHSRNLRDFARDPFQPGLPFLGQCVVVFREKTFERLNHAQDFFLAHFLAAAQCVFMRAVVEQGIRPPYLCGRSKGQRTAARESPSLR